MSGVRGRRALRCSGCGLTGRTCACGLLPKVRIATPLVIVQHVREQSRPTNTARLFARMAEGAAILPWGGRGDAPRLDPSVDWRLLFPGPEAPLLEPGGRPGLVLLDGSWRQCSRMLRRIPGIAGLPCVRLPPAPPSFWTVRRQPRAEGRSTFEAALQAVEILEGTAVAEPLRRAFALVTARFLYVKGVLASPDVPASWGV
jgi:DTW domain-containing protein YfiP